LGGGIDGELEVGRTETTTLADVVQNLLEALHQRQGIALLHVEKLSRGCVLKNAPAPRITS
jgi:hypothetical protein